MNFCLPQTHFLDKLKWKTQTYRSMIFLESQCFHSSVCLSIQCPMHLKHTRTVTKNKQKNQTSPLSHLLHQSSYYYKVHCHRLPPPLLLPTVPRYHILFLNIENSYILRKMTIDNDDDINEDNDDGSSGDSDDGEGSDYW